MASHTGKKESTLFLYMIIPIAVLLTLMFVQVNHNTVPPKATLSGKTPVTEKPAEKPAAAVAAPADTTHAAPADTTHAAPAPAAAAH